MNPKNKGFHFQKGDDVPQTWRERSGACKTDLVLLIQLELEIFARLNECLDAHDNIRMDDIAECRTFVFSVAFEMNNFHLFGNSGLS
jgi:hypothetical protein